MPDNTNLQDGKVWFCMWCLEDHIEFDTSAELWSHFEEKHIRRFTKARYGTTGRWVWLGR